MRFFAAETAFGTVEAYLAAASISFVGAHSEGVTFGNKVPEMERRVIALNRGGRKQ